MKMENNKATAYTPAKKSMGCKAPKEEFVLVFILLVLVIKQGNGFKYY